MTRLGTRFAPDEASVVRGAVDRALDELWRRDHPGRAASRADRPTFGARVADAIVHIYRRFLDPAASGRGVSSARRGPKPAVSHVQSAARGHHARPALSLPGLRLPAVVVRRAPRRPLGSVRPTDLHNLVLLCGRHHHAVHEDGWRMRGDANGELFVTAPDGAPVGASRPPAAERPPGSLGPAPIAA